MAWVKIKQCCSPEKALHVLFDLTIYVTPFHGQKHGYHLSRALPWAGMLTPFHG
jgi:hypothetical protein